MNFRTGPLYSLAVTSGVIAAALAANSPVFAMRLSPTATFTARLDRIRLMYTCIGAFTTPVTAGRRLELIRANTAACAGGTALAAMTPISSKIVASQFDSANGGDVRIATTGALTQVGVVYEANPLRQASLAHVGASGNYQEFLFQNDPDVGDETVVQPGEMLVIRNPVQMDAAGTWQLALNVNWREVPIL